MSHLQYALIDPFKVCDYCSAQEGRHYCLLRSEFVKNMDITTCDEWEEKSEKITVIKTEGVANKLFNEEGKD